MAALRYRSRQSHDVNPRVEEITTSDEEAINKEANSERNTKPKDTRRRRSSAPAPESTSATCLLDVLRFITLFCLCSCLASNFATGGQSWFWGYTYHNRPWFTKWPALKRYLQGPLTLTPAELALYNGSDPSLPIYLAVNGTIFDVSAKSHVYGPGGSYSALAGVDATRGYVTGCLAEDRTPDLRGAELVYIPVEDAGESEDKVLTAAQRKARQRKELERAKAAVQHTVGGWMQFFKTNGAYFEVGTVKDSPGPAKKSLERRRLCQAAERRRPKRSELIKGEKARSASAASEKMHKERHA